MTNTQFAEEIYFKATKENIFENASNGTRQDIINSAIILAYNQAIEDAAGKCTFKETKEEILKLKK
jgi:hypothetical protein